MVISVKDGKNLIYEEAVTLKQVAKDVSVGLSRSAICAKLNGKPVDINRKVTEDCEVEFFTVKSTEGLNVYRHTCAHVLAQAIKSVFPTCNLAAGMSNEHGFYYDVDFKTPITSADLSTLEAEMMKIIKSDLPIERFELSHKDAIKLMKGFHESYKVALIEDFAPDMPVSFYKQGAYTDMCRGPLLPSTGRIKAFKLSSLAGAYWRGNEKNKMLTRIYGLAFAKKSQLDDYLKSVEEAKKRDHNKIGRELGIFATDENAGQGLPVILPAGAKILRVLTRFVEDEEEKRGYLPTKTPFMAKSGFYKNAPQERDKYFSMNLNRGEKYLLRTSLCPFHYSIYKRSPKSYRDLPQKYCETGTVFRNEASGEMHGLIKLRQFTLSDGHVILTPDQTRQEFYNCLDLNLFLLKKLGLLDDVAFRLSTRGYGKKGFFGDDEAWESAQNDMRSVLEELNLDYFEATGEAAPFGPKLDLLLKSVSGKEEILTSIQLDFQAAKDYDLNYCAVSGEKARPYVIHRTAIGCYERTLALLTEKYAGAFPLWLAPVQIKILSVTDRGIDCCNDLKNTFQNAGLRVETDLRREKIGRKIRDAQTAKIPYMVIIGDKEIENKNEISVRSRGGVTETMVLSKFLFKLMVESSKF
ncbi:MAG: threonine--tRNA ligase [Candidatus Borkfalkiaceae bacterium]|nr:threonine--tRNA ligase [Christensenellaceae bacterium]